MERSPHQERQSETSSSLLRRARGRDPRAWERMVALYTPLLYHWCSRAGLADQDIDDVGQEVFCAVWKKLSDFRHDRAGDSFRGWLRVITSNKLRERARRLRTQGPAARAGRAATTPAPPRDPDDQDEGVEIRLLARRAMELIRGEFSDGQWEVFRRAVMVGERPADIAKDLGMSVNSVYLCKSRVLRRLREEFAGLEPNGLF